MSQDVEKCVQVSSICSGEIWISTSVDCFSTGWEIDQVSHHLYTHTHTCTHTHTRTHTHACTHMHVHTHTHTQIPTCQHSSTHTHIYCRYVYVNELDIRLNYAILGMNIIKVSSGNCSFTHQYKYCQLPLYISTYIPTYIHLLCTYLG